MRDMPGATVRLGIIARDVCPPSLEYLAAGKMYGGMFYPIGSVAIWHYERQKTLRKEKAKLTTVYVIRATSGGPVKIGKAKDVPSRLATLQAGCPVPLTVLKTWAEVPEAFEMRLHAAYAEHRLHCEWFAESILPDLLKEETP